MAQKPAQGISYRGTTRSDGLPDRLVQRCISGAVAAKHGEYQRFDVFGLHLGLGEELGRTELEEPSF
jgi:hypothetical protein